VRVLVIGGNRFLGVELTARLLARGDRVTLLNRGTLADPFGDRVERLVCDRTSRAFEAVGASTWDAVVDCALFDGAQAEVTARVLSGRVGHYVMVSTGQVYLVRQPAPEVATERDYDGALMREPPAPGDRDDWQYGMGKRAAEDVVAQSGLPATRLRIPMVHGGRDYHRRLESLLWRLLDGGPVLLTRPQACCRHVYGPAVARAIVTALDRGPLWDAVNLAQDETVTARELVRRFAAQLGVAANVVETTDEALAAAGLEPTKACAFNGRWMSVLDPSKAQDALGFWHEPLDVYLHATAHALVSRMAEPPPSMAQRAGELAFRR
jgi:nucleoside-diphosphate-sugar epimerase